jgi:hypothetical protein
VEQQMLAIRNPVLALAWGLPAVAVAASVLSLLMALRTPESELPEQYHWEGFQLDRDFSQAARATQLKVRASLVGFDASGRCELELSMTGSVPKSLELLVAHATQPRLAQRVKLMRVADSARGVDSSSARYSGSCAAAPDSHWRLELVDARGGWAVRQALHGPLDGATLDAVAGTNE